MADFLVGDWLCNSIAGAPRKSLPWPFRRTFANLKPQMADLLLIVVLRAVWHSLQGARCKNPSAASSPEQLIASGASFSRPEVLGIQLRSPGCTHRSPAIRHTDAQAAASHLAREPGLAVCFLCPESGLNFEPASVNPDSLGSPPRACF